MSLLAVDWLTLSCVAVDVEAKSYGCESRHLGDTIKATKLR